MDIERYIPGILQMKFQDMLEDIDTREKIALFLHRHRRTRLSNIIDR